LTAALKFPDMEDIIIVHPSESHGLLRTLEKYSPGKQPSSAHITTGIFKNYIEGNSDE
jgi:hypothetical protein